MDGHFKNYLFNRTLEWVQGGPLVLSLTPSHMTGWVNWARMSVVIGVYPRMSVVTFQVNLKGCLNESLSTVHRTPGPDLGFQRIQRGKPKTAVLI